MPLTPRQDLMLHLAGTVRLPSPPPATGLIVTVAPPAGREARANDVVLRIVHHVNPLQTIERIVRMAHVRAILAPWPGATGDGPRERGFRTSEEFGAEVAQFAAAHRAADAVWLEHAVAFVDEAAPVVLVSETAQTAAESADYYPPLAGAGRGAKPLHVEDCNDIKRGPSRRHIEDCNDVERGLRRRHIEDCDDLLKSDALWCE